MASAIPLKVTAISRQSPEVASALIKADKDFDLLVIPGAGHGSAEPPYDQRRRQDCFVRHLLGVEPQR